jgi:hypothetical protein
MKPHRLTLTNALVMGYGLDKQIHHVYDPRPATQDELEMYHDHDYIDFLSRSDIICLPVGFILPDISLQGHTGKPVADETHD